MSGTGPIGRESLETRTLQFKPAIPSQFPTSLVSHFPLSSALLCLFPNRMHYASHTQSYTPSLHVLIPSHSSSISDFPSTPLLCLPPTLNSIIHTLPYPP